MEAKRKSVGPVKGRVRFVTPFEGSRRVTVEVAPLKRSYTFRDDSTSPLLESSWIEFSGTVSEEVEEDVLVRTPYLHNPYDGTPKEEWEFFTLWDAEYVRVGPLDLDEAAATAVEALQRLRRRGPGFDHRDLKEALEGVDAIRPILVKEMDSRDPAPAAAVEMDLG